MVYVVTGIKQQQNSGNVELVTFIQDVVRKELVALVSLLHLHPVTLGTDPRVCMNEGMNLLGDCS